MQTTTYEETIDGVTIMYAPIPAGDDEAFVEQTEDALNSMIHGSPADLILPTFVFIQRTDELLFLPIYAEYVREVQACLSDLGPKLLGEVPAQQLATTRWVDSDVTGQQMIRLSVAAARDSAGFTLDMLKSADFEEKIASFAFTADISYIGETRMLGPWREGRAV
jgi:hypothetical protein